MKWPNKDPNESLDYSLDWSRFLRAGSTIVSVNWFIDDASGIKQSFNPDVTVEGLHSYGKVNSNTVATIYLKDGTLNKQYKIYCQMTDNLGFIAERSITLAIKER